LDAMAAMRTTELASFRQITGDTVYNLMKIGDLEADKDDRPVDPPVINSVEVSTVIGLSVCKNYITAVVLLLGVALACRLYSGYVCGTI
jgi:hypothetical protein